MIEVGKVYKFIPIIDAGESLPSPYRPHVGKLVRVSLIKPENKYGIEVRPTDPDYYFTRITTRESELHKVNILNE